MIPNNIRHLKFCRVQRGTKRPFEKDWVNKPYTAEQAEKFISSGEDYGILSGYENIITIDCDHPSYIQAVENLIDVPTFSVMSSTPNKRHFLYHVTDFPKDINKILLVNPDDPSDKELEGGDIRAAGFQSVGPGSLHPTGKIYQVVTDLPIASISFEQILYAFSDFFKTTLVRTVTNTDTSISMSDVINHYGIAVKGHGDEKFGPHPIHGSKNGKRGTNLNVNFIANVWHCHRCNSGGDPIHFVAMMERIIECNQSVKGSLRGDRFKQVASIIKEKFNINIIDKQSGDVSKLIEKIPSIEAIPLAWDRLKAIDAICPDVAKLSAIDQQVFFSALKDKIKIHRDEMSALKSRIKKVRNQSKNNTLDLDDNGCIVPTHKNLISIMSTDTELSGCFKRNTFSGELDVVKNGTWELKKDVVPRPVSNDDDYQVKNYIINNYHVEYKLKDIQEGVTQISIINNYNPVLDYLNSLKWDGVPRLETWIIDYCGSIDNSYVRKVAAMTLVAAVRRAKRPGCQYDHVVCLAGDQGIMKSTLIKTLGAPWYLPIHMNDNLKDTVQKMQGQWFCEIPEGVSFNHKDIESLKAFITETFNRERFAYERRIERYMRRSIFMLTINPKTVGYLADPTGNRRFLPIRMNSTIKINEISLIKDQLFAEACVLESQNYKIYIDKNDEDIIDGHNKELEIAEVNDEWVSAILQWIATGMMCSLTQKDYHGNKTLITLKPQVTCLDIWVSAIGGEIKNYNQYKEGQRIGEIMRKLGCTPKTTRIDKSVSKSFDISCLMSGVVQQAEAVKWED